MKKKGSATLVVIIFCIISFTILKLATKKKEEVNIYLVLLSIVFVLKFIFLK